MQNHTCSTIIEEAKRSPLMKSVLLDTIWSIVSKHELAGMEGADLEPGTLSMLQYLYGKLHLVVVTNNSVTAAVAALNNLGILHYFDHIAGREQMAALKPSPSGIYYILGLYTDTDASMWIAVGDSWIDGKAAQKAEVQFIYYGQDIDMVRNKGVFPDAVINHIGELVGICGFVDGSTNERF